MSKIDRFMDATNDMLNEEQRKCEDARNEKELYSELKEEAMKKEKQARATVRELELAKLHAEKAKETYAASDETITDGSLEPKTVYVDDERHTTTKSSGVGRSIINLVVAAALLAGGAYGYKLYRESKTGDVKAVDEPTKTASDTVRTNPETKNNDMTYNYENNEVVVTSAPGEEIKTTETEEVVTQEAATEELTTENFETLVADYANKYSNEYSAVSTEDITKFAVVANMDLLAEENPELIKEVAGETTKEEFLNDAAKLIGTTVMNNFNVWNATQSTENFVRVSDVIYGEQKDKMIKIEEYVDRIATAANAGDKDLVNQIVSEFILDMNSGDLSKLDDGVGFVAQVNIAMISDGIARNYLNQENFDMLQILKTSEKYVSNIFTVYDKCTGEVYTRTR